MCTYRINYERITTYRLITFFRRDTSFSVEKEVSQEKDLLLRNNGYYIHKLNHPLGVS